MHVLGIDAGATKSHVVLWDESQFSAGAVEPSLLNTKHPGLNLDVIAAEEAGQRLWAMFEEAARVIEKELTDFFAQTNIVVGMAGLDTDLDRENAQTWLDDTLRQRVETANVRLVPDVELALWSASASGVGVLLIAGTGSNCFGRNSDGKTAKAGGLSHFFADEGSGFMLGWEALHRVAQMYDGRLPKETIYDEVLQEYGESDFPHLKRRIVQSADYKHEVAKAAPAIQKLAHAGDPHALALVEGAVAQLAVMVQTVYKQISTSEALPVFMVGGLFQDNLYRENLSKTLAGLGITAEVKHVEFPVIGALRMAAGTPA